MYKICQSGGWFPTTNSILIHTHIQYSNFETWLGRNGSFFSYKNKKRKYTKNVNLKILILDTGGVLVCFMQGVYNT